MQKISATIITYNEESCIADCIDSLSAVADEIIVVDSYSQDTTKQICLDKKVRFFENQFNGYIDQKNFAVSLAQFEHIISLDADERLSEQLIESILTVKENWSFDAYSMNRLSTYGGKSIKRGNWYPDRQIRLWDRKQGVWGGKIPHEKLVLKNGCKKTHLKGDILHDAYKNSAETIRKIQSYSEIFAQENVGKMNSNVFKIISHSCFAFFKSYLVKRGIFDGFEGLMVAMAEANHTFYKYAKLYEYNRNSHVKNNNVSHGNAKKTVIVSEKESELTSL